MDPLQVIIEPIVTEKTARARENSMYVFRVLFDATKDQIKLAMKQAFGVDVLSVNTTKVRGKSRTLGRSIGTTSKWKKAYVKLKQGQKIKELEAGA
jgi:large subunit ribosomal protein L23